VIGATAEGNIGNDGCVEREMNCSLSESDDTCPPDIHRVSNGLCFNDFRGDIAERASKRGELLVGKM